MNTEKEQIVKVSMPYSALEMTAELLAATAKMYVSIASEMMGQGREVEAKKIAAKSGEMIEAHRAIALALELSKQVRKGEV